MYAVSTGILVTEPARHFHSNMTILNQFYEWPRSRAEYNIFFKEIFRLPDFWSELGKKVAYGHIAAAGSSAVQLAMWQTVYGGTWSP